MFSCAVQREYRALSTRQTVDGWCAAFGAFCHLWVPRTSDGTLASLLVGAATSATTLPGSSLFLSASRDWKCRRIHDSERQYQATVTSWLKASDPRLGLCNAREKFCRNDWMQHLLVPHPANLTTVPRRPRSALCIRDRRLSLPFLCADLGAKEIRS